MNIDLIYMKKLFFLLVTLCCISYKTAISSQNENSRKFSFTLSTWNATLDPKGLKIYGSLNSNSEDYLIGRGPNDQFQDPQLIEKSEHSITFFYSSQHMKVKITNSHNRLFFNFNSSIEQKLTWPLLAEDPKTKAIIYPEGEGLYIPTQDTFWHKQLEGLSLDTQGQLSAPFWGYDLKNASLNIIVHHDLLNELHFKVKEQKLINLFSHHFRKMDALPDFEISFNLSNPDLIASAKNYKNYLIETNHYKTLEEKIAENSEIEKLIGAIHIYVWGDGRTVAALNKLSALNINHLWIGYEDKPLFPPQGRWIKKQYYVDSSFIKKARELGYLIGPYDSFHTMQSPSLSDCANDVFDDLYPKGCIHLKNGNTDKGFGNRGCHVSSEALKRQRPENKTLINRINRFIDSGINSYFLDCDATGELFDDYSQDHPMRQDQDRQNRLKRMSYIALTKKMVLGSETAAAWAVPLLAFSHGNFSVHNKLHWPFTKSKEYGSWYPPERPLIFFKPTLAPSDYSQARYNPFYRLPLLQTVFHEAIVITDRWEISHMKLKNLVKRREIFELLYGIPSIWALDLKDIEKHGLHLKKLSHFFSRLHRAIIFKPLTDFRWLTEDHLIQQVTFDNSIILTANFSSKDYKDIPPEALQIKGLGENNVEIYQISDKI